MTYICMYICIYIYVVRHQRVKVQWVKKLQNHLHKNVTLAKRSHKKSFFYGSSPAGTIYKCKFIGLSSISIKLILATPRKNKRLARLVTHKFLNDNKDNELFAFSCNGFNVCYSLCVCIHYRVLPLTLIHTAAKYFTIPYKFTNITTTPLHSLQYNIFCHNYKKILYPCSLQRTIVYSYYFLCVIVSTFLQRKSTTRKTISCNIGKQKV